jgi:Ser/Thr protein kinase RdoA (MazF antagonist)
VDVSPGPDEVRAVAERFRVDGSVAAVLPVPGGHINDTYRIETRHPDGTRRGYLLQRLNSHVFARPNLVMENVARVVRHLAQRSARYPALVLSRDNGDWVTDTAGRVWRMFVHIDGARVREHVQSPADARGAGQAFGEFLRLLADAGLTLHETMPGFHDTSARFARLDAAVRTDSNARAAQARVEIDAVLAERALADMLPPLLASGAVSLRPVHNDAKIANVLFDAASGDPLCVIDLDTVMPGSALHDFGDLVRSSVSPTTEDETDVSKIRVRSELFRALARGYLESAGDVLTAHEVRLLGFAGRLITLEQAMRFLTDHLEGDRYYRINRPGHNLIRCRAQLALLQSLTDQATSLERIIVEVS